ncbi:amino acid ABC transporter substrate-binding protein [Lacimicrobium alkaliphilum]|nr:amino acid ABC transporter substrate-binding protein [Lacimicrobium alkaliphilum]
MAALILRQCVETMLRSCSYRIHLALKVLVVAFFLALNIVLLSPYSTSFPLSDYSSVSCNVAQASGNSEILRVLTITSSMAQQQAEFLCQSRHIGQHFAEVMVSWHSRDFLTAEQLINEDYDVIWNREHVMRGLVPDFHHYYDVLQPSSTYNVYWFSLGEAPRLEAGFLEGKRIGLLDHSTSKTSFLLPLDSLKTAGLKLAQLNISYFVNMKAMYDALEAGEIDIIPGGNWVADQLAPLVLQKTLIAENVDAGSWYVRKRITDPSLRCAMQRSIQVYQALSKDMRMPEIAAPDCL